VAHDSGALRTRDLARVTVDTTVQPKNIAFSTDARLLHAAIKGLNRLARHHGVRLRQSYLRLAKQAAMWRGAMPTPSSSTATIEKCASCAPGSVG
jgi:transposase, IS5 family